MNHTCLTWYYNSLKLSMIHRTPTSCNFKCKIHVEECIGWPRKAQDWPTNHISWIVTPIAYIITSDICKEQME
jgi:hypothetical protein